MKTIFNFNCHCSTFFALLLFLFTLYVAVIPSEAVKIFSNHASALLEFKSNLNDPNHFLSSWNSSLPCEQWQGVQCDQVGKVTQIQIEGGNLTGSLSDKIGNIFTLQKLSLNNIFLRGELPESIGNLGDLVYLSIAPDFGMGGLNGFIPSSLGKLTNLVELYLDNNQFIGSIPDSFSNLVNLKILDLSQNYLTSLNPNMKNMINLQILKMNCNLISGSIPSFIGEMKNLKILDFFLNSLDGEIPESFKNLINLEEILFDDNKINSTIPEFFGNLTNLKNIQFSRNQLYGSIPSTLGNLLNLEEFICKQNSLSGPLPSSLGNLKNLKNLVLNDNKLSGNIPSSFGNLIKIEKIKLNNNSLEGQIPESFKNLVNLKTLRLHMNNFSGEINSGFKNLLSLNELILSYNSFSGKFSSSVFKHPNLNYLDLSNNNFSGELILNSTNSNLFILNIRNNRFTKINLSNFQTKSLYFFDASDNKINNEFNFLSAPNLETLKLNRINFKGRFSLTNKELTSLSILILDDNQISAVSSLNILKNLTFISLTNNKFVSFSSNYISENNLTVLLNKNPLCSHNSPEQKLHNLSSTCSPIRSSLSSNFPYTKLSNSEITKNPNLVALMPHPCKNACDKNETFYFSESIFVISGKCTCVEVLQIFIRLDSPSFSIFTQANKREIERNIANFHKMDDPLRVKIDSVTEFRGSQIMKILIFPPDITATLYPLFNAYAITFPFKRDVSLLIGEKFGPFSFLNSSINSMIAREILYQKDLKPKEKTEVKKKKIFPLWVLALIIPLSFFVLSFILLFIIFKLKQNKKKNSNLNVTDSEFIIKTDTVSKSNSTMGITNSSKSTDQSYLSKFIPLPEIMEATESFSQTNCIGSGGYGEVYKGKSTLGQLWAVKRAKLCSEQSFKTFHNEVELISGMNHKNLVRLIGYCDEEENQILVYEFIPNGTLKYNLNDRNNKLNFYQRIKIAFGTAQALNYLHNFANQPIIHRDIKTENILLDEKFEAKLCDFGLLKHMPAGNLSLAMSTRVAGTPGYMDPEYYKTFRVTASSDVYSFGVVLLELLTGKSSVLEDMTPVDESYIVTVGKWALPYVQKGSIEEIIDPNLKFEFEKNNYYPSEALKWLSNLAYECLQEIGKNRPTMEEVTWKLGQIRNLFEKVKEENWSQEIKVQNLPVPNSANLDKFDLIGGSSKEFVNSFDSSTKSKEELNLNLER